MLNLKKFYCLSVLVSFIFMSSCQKTKVESQISANKILKVGAASWVFKPFPLEEAAKKYEATHPDVKVILSKSPETTGTKLLMDWDRRKTTYDIFIGLSAKNCFAPILKGHLMPLDKIFEKIPKEKFIESYLKLGEIENKVYSLPLCGEIMVIIYRVDYFKKAGFIDKQGNVILPKTWDEVYQYAKKLTQDTNNDGTIDIYGIASPLTATIDQKIRYAVWAYVSSKGGKVLDKDGNYNLKSKEMEEALSFLVKLRKEGYLLPDCHVDDSVGRNAFKSGKIAMYITWHSRLGEAQEMVGKENANLMLLPGAKKNGSYISDGTGIIIPKYGNIDLAMDFLIEMLCSEWFQVSAAEKFGKMPTLKNYIKNLKEPYWQDLVDNADISFYDPMYYDFQKMADEISLQFSNALLGLKPVSTSLNDAYENIKNLKK